MSFIGNVPAEAYSPTAKDTFSGDGSTTDFTLSIPATTNSVEVLVENVQQEPTTAYTISGTTLSFTAAPVTGTNNIYVIHRGPAVQTVVPPAGVAIDASSVTATGDISTEGDLKVEVASGGIYTITGTDTASNRTLTLPDEAGTVLTSASSITSQAMNGPAFSAYSTGSNVSLTNGTDTKVIFDAERFDTDSCFDTGTYRFTPNVAGYYFFYASVYSNWSGTNHTGWRTMLFKNGSAYLRTDSNVTGTDYGNVNVSGLIYLNGSTDYVEVYVWATGGTSPTYSRGSGIQQFSGHFVRGA